MQRQDGSWHDRRLRLLPGQIALGYGVVSILWIYLVDQPLTARNAALAGVIGPHAWRDWTFLVLTAVALYGLVQWGVGKLLRTSEALRQAHDRLRAVIAASPLAILTIDTEGLITGWNAAAERMFGWTEAEVLGGTNPIVPPEKQSEYEDLIHRGLRGEVFTGVQVRRQTRSGTGIDVSISTAPVFGANGEVAGIVSVIADITRQKHQDAALELLRAVDRGILHDLPPDAVFAQVCERLVEQYASPLVWIGLLQPDGRVEIKAMAGSQVAYLEDTTVHWDQPLPGPVGRAVRSRAVHCANFDQEAGFLQWRDRARASGLAAICVAPLMVHGEPFGVLVLYSRRPDGFGTEEVHRLQVLADQVAISFQAARHRDQIRLQTAALEAAANAVVITDRNGIIRWANLGFTHLTGYSSAEVCGLTPRVLKSGQQPPSFYRLLWSTILAGQTWQGEIMNRRKNGSLYREEQTITPVRDADGAISHFIAIKQDVTERRRHEEQLRRLATSDALTDLPNLHAFQDRLGDTLRRLRSDQTGALMILDLDDFRVINDIMGHPAGNRYLTEIARLIRRVLPPGTFLARLGEDEFGALIGGVPFAEVLQIAEHLRRDVAGFRFRSGEDGLSLGASIGLVPLQPGDEVKHAIGLANAALSAAKEKGKNRVVANQARPDEPGGLAAPGRMAVVLSEALAAERLELLFQPIVSLADGRVVSHEALIRLLSPSGERIGPEIFLSIAERLGIMVAIDRWVADQALQLLSNHPHVRVFVNLSGRSLGDDDLLEFLARRVQESGEPAHRIVFEITESAAVNDLERAERWMTRLRAFGCRFALDDFGIGLSSFSYLRALPVDYVKIAGTFIRNLDGDSANRAIVQAITGVAHALGMEVIAEWVETEAVAGMARELGVEYGQGFLWQRPEPWHDG